MAKGQGNILKLSPDYSMWKTTVAVTESPPSSEESHSLIFWPIYSEDKIPTRFVKKPKA